MTYEGAGVSIPHTVLNNLILRLESYANLTLVCSYRSRVSPLDMSSSELESFQHDSGLIGEDSAVFSFENQSLKSWGAFLAVLGTVLTALYFLWLNPDTGYGKTTVLKVARVSRRQYVKYCSGTCFKIQHSFCVEPRGRATDLTHCL